MKFGRWAGPDHIRNLYTQRIKLDLDAYFFVWVCHGFLWKSDEINRHFYRKKCFYMCKMQYVRLQRSPVVLQYNSILVKAPG